MKRVNNTLIVFIPKNLSFRIWTSWMKKYTIEEVRSKKSYLVRFVFDVKDDGIEAEIRKSLSEFVEEDFYMFYRKQK